MTRLSISVLGDKEIVRLIRRLPQAVRRPTLERATLAGAKLIADEARRKAPRDDGTLRKGIRARVAREIPNTSEARAGARHSHLVEFGTRGERRVTKARAMPIEVGSETIFRPVVGPMPAQPFFRPAVAAKTAAALERVRKIIAAEVEKHLK